MRNVLKNLTNSDLLNHEAVLDAQQHVLNFNNQRMKHFSGLRELILTRNKFGDEFAKGIQPLGLKLSSKSVVIASDFKLASSVATRVS